MNVGLYQNLLGSGDLDLSIFFIEFNVVLILFSFLEFLPNVVLRRYSSYTEGYRGTVGLPQRVAPARAYHHHRFLIYCPNKDCFKLKITKLYILGTFPGK